MTKLIELKDRVCKFCGAYEIYLTAVVKFLVAFTLFCTIHNKIGFMSQISTLQVTGILAFLCCLFPYGMTIFVAAGLVLLHLYVLSLEAALLAGLVFLTIYFVYFRFAPKEGLFFALTPILLSINIPYVLPMAAGLLRNLSTVFSIICGTIVFYFIEGVSQNVGTLSAEAEQGEILTIMATQLLGNKEMYLTIGIFTVTVLVVFVIRRLSIDHAWKIALISGTLIQISGFLAGYMILSISGKTMYMIIGNLVSLLLGFVLEFIFFGLDYERTETVQFEDDEYYYYVKAVPKKMISSANKKVKEFGTVHKKESLREENRKRIAKELEIDENLLK